MRFDSLEQRLINDLIWAATSIDMMQLDSIQRREGLLSIEESPAANKFEQWLRGNNHQPALMSLIQERQPRRLGIYFEVLWQYILEHYPGFKFIARNLPVTSNKRTLGEMDFIYFCKVRQRYIHLETAVKFYLGLPTDDEKIQMSWSNWIGPGCIDRLDLKLDKMLSKQTRLSTTIEGVDVLAQQGIHNPVQEICLKGYFFYPLINNCSSPSQSHPQHARGYWLKEQQLPSLEHETNWYIMKKEEWLSPVVLPEKQVLMSKTALLKAINNELAFYNFPIMVANMTKTATGYTEEKRFFITPNDWPQLPAEDS